MATNIPGTRPSSRPSDDVTPVETATMPVVTPTAAGGVAVYDRDGDVTPNPSLRPSTSMVGDRVPVEARSTGSMLTWIISAVVLIVVVYFLLQYVF